MPSNDQPRPRAFTLIELMFVIAVVFVLLALLIVGIRHATKLTRGALDTALVSNLKTSVGQFKNEFGFIPPLVKDNDAQGPFDVANQKARVYQVSSRPDRDVLRGQVALSPQSQRHSAYTLAYYVVGATDGDGVPGPGFREPRRDGSFKTDGKKFDPFIDTSKGLKVVPRDPEDPAKSQAALQTEARYTLLDRQEIPIRYYMWLRGDDAGVVTGDPLTLNIPPILGDPAEKPELKNADAAIVGAGPNGVFGDEQDRAPGFVAINYLKLKMGLSDTVSDAEVRRRAAADNVIGTVR